MNPLFFRDDKIVKKKLLGSLTETVTQDLIAFGVFFVTASSMQTIKLFFVGGKIQNLWPGLEAEAQHS